MLSERDVLEAIADCAARYFDEGSADLSADVAFFDDLREKVEELELVRERKRLPWWRRLRLTESGRVWGLSYRWFAVCPWNGTDAWVQLPFVYLGANPEHVELDIGHGKLLMAFEIRWRWS